MARRNTAKRKGLPTGDAGAKHSLGAFRRVFGGTDAEVFGDAPLRKSLTAPP